MRKVVLSVYSSLDGFINPLEWTGPYSGLDHGAYTRKLLFASDALIAGRESWESFAAVWADRTSADDGPGEEGFIDYINAMPKYVASRTLQAPLAWNNSTLIQGDFAQAVADLKQQSGMNILMYGAGPLGATLMRAGLVDEVHIWAYPAFAGEGVPIFGGAADLPYLQLVDSTRLSSGVLINVYAPDRMHAA